VSDLRTGTEQAHTWMRGRKKLLAFAATLVCIPAAQGSAQPGSTAASCIPRWRAVASANVPNLADVAALSPTDVWAVGAKRPGAQTIPAIAHWDGRKLKVVQAFRRSSKQRSGSLTGISAVSSREVWAVGTEGGGGKIDLPVVEHWNGTRWQVVETRRLRTGAELWGITAISQKDVWVVGQVDTRPLAEHWDGRRWRLINMRREGALFAVDGASAGDTWAVGAQGLTSPTVNDQDGLVMHWNGRRWQTVSAPYRDDQDLGVENSDDFVGVDAVSRSKAWAAHNGVVRGDIQHWDGRRWRVAHVFPGKSILGDVAAVSPADVWAVGSTSYSRQEQRPVTAHWDGRSWRTQYLSAGRPRQTLRSLSVLSPNDIWAAGDHLIARYSC
jgi:hypothetical protein